MTRTTTTGDTQPAHRWSVGLWAVVVGVAFLWSYWPDLVATVTVWTSDPDYSHGFLVLPIAGWFLWTRRDRFAWGDHVPALGGLGLIVLALVIRYFADRFFLYEIAAWSMVVWLAGACWLVGGWRFFRWSLPAVAFLMFAMKIPLRYERMLSGPLQSIATDWSCWTLQLMGLPAFAEGNTILLGDERLAVAEACAGLRMTFGVFALAYAFTLLMDRPWWHKLMIWLMAAPVAVAANTLRIVATGLLYYFNAGEAVRQLAHDMAGLLVIPVAAALMAAVLWVLANSTKQIEVPSARASVA